MILVTLQKLEWDAAEAIGLKREALRRSHGRSVDKSVLDGGGSNDKRNSIGAVAEYALAKHYGPDVLRDWAENKAYVHDARLIPLIPCDVGRNLHVRATDKPHGRLIVHEAPDQKEHPSTRRHRRKTDKPGGVFILAYVDAETRTVTFRGWRMSEWVQANAPWNDYDNGFCNQDRHAFTPETEDLLPMHTIPLEAIR